MRSFGAFRLLPSVEDFTNLMGSQTRLVSILLSVAVLSMAPVG